MLLYSLETCNSGAFLEFNVRSSSPSKIRIEKSGTICSAILLFPAYELPGFGFNFDPRNDEMVVDWVIENSPAVGVLQSGDTFVSVGGVPATRENRENGILSFTGLPGQPVTAVVKRDGQNVDVSFKRGLVNPRYTKAQVIDNIESADADDWGADEHKIVEVAANRKENVVYAWTWHKFTDDITGLQYEENQVTRFQFNDDGLVVARGDMSEETLVQSQLGFKVSR